MNNKLFSQTNSPVTPYYITRRRRKQMLDVKSSPIPPPKCDTIGPFGFFATSTKVGVHVDQSWRSFAVTYADKSEKRQRLANWFRNAPWHSNFWHTATGYQQ